MVLQIYGYGKMSPRAPSIIGSNPSVRDGKNEEERTSRVRREDWIMMMMMERDKTGNGLWRSGVCILRSGKSEGSPVHVRR